MQDNRGSFWGAALALVAAILAYGFFVAPLLQVLRDMTR